MRYLFTFFTVSFFCISCNTKSKTNKIEKTDYFHFDDSLLIGEPQISTKEFILKYGSDNNTIYLDQFIDIIKKNSLKYEKYPFNDKILNYKLNEHITLCLKRKYCSNCEKDIQIELFTINNSKRIDSLMFFKYQIDNEDVDQRLETISYLDYKWNIWNLVAYSNHTEGALALEKYTRYQIDTISGKIILVEDMNPY